MNRNRAAAQAGSILGTVSCLGSPQSGSQYFLLYKNEPVNSSVAAVFLQSIDHRCYLEYTLSAQENETLPLPPKKVDSTILR